MIRYETVQEMVHIAQKEGRNISDLVMEDQAAQLDKPVEDLYQQMLLNLQVMKESTTGGLSSINPSPSGLSGGDAFKMNKWVEAGSTLGGKILGKMLARALAASETNACMGRIVAAPTAGSCGILPAVLITLQAERGIPDDAIVKGLFTAAGIGMVIARQASISGAEGGCQAECGSASAMAAAAAVEVTGGTPAMVAHACALALQNTLGLVCDPVAGLVEVPCIKRNAMGAANALISAEMALAGIGSLIPVDEVIAAMKAVGDAMSVSLRETAQGGLADTPTARRMTREIFGESKA